MAKDLCHTMQSFRWVRLISALIFTRAKISYLLNQYTVSAKWTIVKQERVLKFDREEKTISASGKFEWVKDLPENLEIFDPLNAQIQIRKKVMQGAQTFSLLLPEIKTGEIESNQYKLNADADCLVGEKIYQCKVVQRERPQENRTTTYFLSPELGYLIVKIEDQDSKWRYSP